MKIGDKVLYEGKVAEVVGEKRPRCKCKGLGYYELSIEGYPENHKVPLDVILEYYVPLTMANQKIETHKF
jgi:hypothetical protein